MDDADRVTEIEAQMEALRRLRTPKGGPDATGECLNCSAPLADGIRWCDKTCTEDWERRAAAQ